MLLNISDVIPRIDRFRKHCSHRTYDRPVYRPCRSSITLHFSDTYYYYFRSASTHRIPEPLLSIYLESHGSPLPRYIGRCTKNTIFPRDTFKHSFNTVLGIIVWKLKFLYENPKTHKVRGNTEFRLLFSWIFSDIVRRKRYKDRS